MSASVIIVIVVVVVVIALAAPLLSGQWRRRRLRTRFGPEYDHVLRTTDNRREAERELAQREQRHATLELRPLAESARQAYEADWTRVQERFVDAPAGAVADADQLITALLADRGYPTTEFEQQAADLSVEHAHVVEKYRRAHAALAAGRTEGQPAEAPAGDGAATTGEPTDDLRRAMLDYRDVFEAVLGRDETTELHDSRA